MEERPAAVFEPHGAGYLPTSYARGPWNPAFLHGGAVAALIAHAVERHEPETPWFVARMTIDLDRAVPMEELRVAVATARPGRRVQLVEATLSTPDRNVARARVVRISGRSAEDQLDVHPVELVVPVVPGPESGFVPEWHRNPDDWWLGLLHAMDVRIVHGDFGVPGPASAWFRLQEPIVEGTEPSPLERVATIVDFGSGVGAPVRFDEWLYINPELSFHLAREPVGEWVLIESGSLVDGAGVGLTETAISDGRGRIGRAAQSVLLDVLPS